MSGDGGVVRLEEHVLATVRVEGCVGQGVHVEVRCRGTVWRGGGDDVREAGGASDAGEEGGYWACVRGVRYT